MWFNLIPILRAWLRPKAMAWIVPIVQLNQELSWFYKFSKLTSQCVFAGLCHLFGESHGEFIVDELEDNLLLLSVWFFGRSVKLILKLFLQRIDHGLSAVVAIQSNWQYVGNWVELVHGLSVQCVCSHVLIRGQNPHNIWQKGWKNFEIIFSLSYSNLQLCMSSKSLTSRSSFSTNMSAPSPAS